MHRMKSVVRKSNKENVKSHKNLVKVQKPPSTVSATQKHKPGMYKGRVVRSKVDCFRKPRADVKTTEKKVISKPDVTRQKPEWPKVRSKSLSSLPTSTKPRVSSRPKSVSDIQLNASEKPVQVSVSHERIPQSIPCSVTQEGACAVPRSAPLATGRSAISKHLAPKKNEKTVQAEKPKPATTEQRVCRPVTSIVSQYRVQIKTAEERRAKFAEWKGKTLKRPPILEKSATFSRIPKPAPRPKTGPKATIGAQSEAVVRSEAEAVVRSEAEAVVRSEAEAVVRSEAEAVVRSEAEAVVRSEAEAEAVVRSEAEAEAVVRSEAEAEAVVRSEAEAEAVVRSEAEAVVRSEAEAVVRSEAEAVVRSEAEAVVRSEAEAVVRSEAEAVVRSEAEAVVRSEAEAVVRSEAEAVVRSEAEAVVQSEAVKPTADNQTNDNEVPGNKTVCSRRSSNIMNPTLDLLDTSDVDLPVDPETRMELLVLNLCDKLEAMKMPSSCEDGVNVDKSDAVAEKRVEEQAEEQGTEEVFEILEEEELGDEDSESNITEDTEKAVIKHDDDYQETKEKQPFASEDDDSDEKMKSTTPKMAGACIVKYNVKTTPYLQRLKKIIECETAPDSSSRRRILIKDLKFLTPVRRSTRIQQKSSSLPGMLNDHDTCVSSFAELMQREDANANAYIYRKNPALLEEMPDQPEDSALVHS